MGRLSKALLVCLSISILTIGFLFAETIRRVPPPGSMQIYKTDTPLSAQLATGVFAVLNVPAIVVFVLLETTLPRSFSPLLRETIVFGCTAIVTIMWWGILLRLVRARVSTNS
jgi:hypothetical protein